ncbi:hypothetical protein LX64_04332 [Chitinophaga skermanii]|uniref:Uncharacterized protein n=1 Tax=Chitinophaga skermanii TaxID=331697 RepID=A0A327Q5S3_9BACT|nr:hypothetical protein [Chitinophaga skermanii]RAI99779.1 hypothetical protein LX64_04332 [Chitinophaga skermanii]
MYYLSCIKCFHRNKLTGESVTFCEKCGERLPFNFQDFKANRPNSTFQEYLALQPGLGNDGELDTVSNPPPIPTSSNSQRKTPQPDILDIFEKKEEVQRMSKANEQERRHNRAIIAMVLVAFLFFAGWVVKTYIIDRLDPYSYTTFHDGSEKNITIQTPFEMKKLDKMPDYTKASAIYFGGSDTLGVIYGYQEMAKGYGLDFKSVAQNITSSFKSQFSSMKDMDITEGVVGQQSAWYCASEMTYKGAAYELKIVVAGGLLEASYVGVFCRKDQPAMLKSMEKIIKSAGFKTYKQHADDLNRNSSPTTPTAPTASTNEQDKEQPKVEEIKLDNPNAPANQPDEYSEEYTGENSTIDPAYGLGMSNIKITSALSGGQIFSKGPVEKSLAVEYDHAFVKSSDWGLTYWENTQRYTAKSANLEVVYEYSKGSTYDTYDPANFTSMLEVSFGGNDYLDFISKTDAKGVVSKYDDNGVQVEIAANMSKGLFKYAGRDRGFYVVHAGQAKELWVITIVYDPKDKASERKAVEVFMSINFKKK